MNLAIHVKFHETKNKFIQRLIDKTQTNYTLNHQSTCMQDNQPLLLAFFAGYICEKLYRELEHKPRGSLIAIGVSMSLLGAAHVMQYPQLLKTTANSIKVRIGELLGAYVDK